MEFKGFDKQVFCLEISVILSVIIILFMISSPYLLILFSTQYCNKMAKSFSGISYKFNRCLVKTFCSSIVERSKHYEDAVKVNETFKQFGYECEIIKDFTQHKLIKELQRIANDSLLLEYDGLILIFISNGYNDSMQCYDGIEVKFEHVINYFTNEKCEYLNGKPKLIIFNINQKS